jgi:HD-like signal output (HDOD) protein
MKNILFVDDEPMILQGLQRMLRPQSKLWDMSFATSGADALAMLETKPFDAIVTDMRMPGMDGARLLELVRERHPAVIRIVLSGFFDTEAAMRAVPVAHQFLAKPCDPGKLRDALEHCCGFAGLLRDAALRQVVGAIGRLPALPRTTALLVETLQKPEASLDEIGRIVEHDVGITAKLLQLVNSAFFCLPGRVTSVRMAVSYLGLDTLKHLVLSAEMFRSLQPRRPIPGFSLEQLEKHSHFAAGIASRLPAPQPIVSTGVIAAVLHDAGKLVLAASLPYEFQLALESSKAQQRPLHVVEEEQMGTSHAGIGAYLLGLWGLPDSIVDAVWRHHHPRAREGDRALDVAAITHVADGLACEVARGQGEDAPVGGVLDLTLLADLGLDAKLPAWRTMARQVHEDLRRE